MSRDIQPLFVSTLSYPDQGGILTLDDPGKAKPGCAFSVFDLVKEGGLKELVLVEEHPDAMISAFRGCEKLGVKLCFGLKLVVCADALAKTDESLHTQSKAIIFCLNEEGRHDLIRIWNRASTEGFYYTARTSWAWLTEQWTPNLTLALPFFSSFIARNRLSFDRIVPTLPARPIVFKEVGSDLPFAPLIDGAIDRYVADNPADVLECKTIYYARRADLEPFIVYRAIGERSTFDAPNVDHLSSAEFSWEAYKELTS